MAVVGSSVEFIVSETPSASILAVFSVTVPVTIFTPPLPENVAGHSVDAALLPALYRKALFGP